MTAKNTRPLLAIETSCDETAISVVEQRGEEIVVRAENIASQVDIHAATGGVVPEAAAREHLLVLRPLLRKTLSEAQVEGRTLAGIAVTIGPGLQPALSMGVTVARTLSYAWGIPLIPVHHLEGHIYSALLQESRSSPRTFSDVAPFPAIALIVSGGHTLFVRITNHLQYQVIGTTRDDAAGEAFDKVARLLELPYPGGPEIARVAEGGDATRFNFPRAMQQSGDYDVSFSGLKTAVLYALRELSDAEKEAQKAHLAASFQQAVVDTLVTKLQHIITNEQPASVLLAGGVAANTSLREAVIATAATADVPARVAPLTLCGDNATMIGLVGMYAHAANRHATWEQVDAYPRLDITRMSDPGYWGLRDRES